MNVHAKVTSKGQITLPAKLRRELGLSAGDIVDFRKTESGAYELVTKKHSLSDLRGALSADDSLSERQLDKWIEEARGGRADEFGG